MAYEVLDEQPSGRYEVLPPASVRAGSALNDIPRQLGLTARYGIEGLANTAQVVTEPLRYLTDKFLPDRGGVSNLVTGQAAPPKSTPLGVQATKLADMIGLPSPENANERVIGDASRLVAGSGGLAKASQLAMEVPGLAGTVFTKLAENLPAQFGSAAGAGLAGGASREAGGGQIQQAGASLLGGVAGGLAPGAASSVINASRSMMAPKLTPQQIDVQIAPLFERTGADYSQVPENVRRTLRTELASSLQAGKEIDPAAVRRLADFATVGATPTRGMVSQNPVQITREMNLAKMGANSADDQLHGLPMLQNQNNATIINRLNELGAGRNVSPLDAGRIVSERIQGTNAALGAVENGAWRFAKDSPGYKQPIYPDGLNAAMREVGDEALTGYLPKQVTDYMAAFQTGQQPFTPQHYKNLRSMLSGELAKGGNEAAAARAAIRGLDSAPITPITNPRGVDFGAAPVTEGLAGAMRSRDAQAGNAIDAVDRARAATAAKYRYQESSPLVRSALSDARTADPEKIAQSFVLNGTLNDARSVAREVGPTGVATIRDAIANDIKRQALSGAADETGKVSQSALNRAINKIGAEKMGLFFSPDEIAQLRATGRVASYMQAQPVGSAVNNSNSGALLLGRGMDLLNKTPVIGPMVGPAFKNMQLSIGQRAAENVRPGLLVPTESPRLGPALLLPGIAAGGGLLSSP